MLCLEGAQAGLSWATILKRRDRYRQVFDGFQPQLIAQYDAAKVAALLADPGIVRNRAKVAATIQNAKAFLDLTASGRTLPRLSAGSGRERDVLHRRGTRSRLPARALDRPPAAHRLRCRAPATPTRTG